VNSYALTPQAVDDLFDVWSYIARDSFEAADRVETSIYQACAFVAEAPLRGQTRKELFRSFGRGKHNLRRMFAP
jgi:plasmid stabilization system protein ParE